MSRFVMPLQSSFAQNVSPFDGSKLFFFSTGTSTPKDTFSDSALTIPNANPVIADANGLFPKIFLNGTYKVRLLDKNNFQIWEEDPVDEFATTSELTLNIELKFVKKFDTLALAVADINLLDGDTVDLKDRVTDDGAGGKWDVVSDSSVTINTIDIVQATGVSTLALVFRPEKTVDIKQLGAVAATDASAEINRAALIANDVLISANYLYDVIFLKDGLTLRGENKATLTLTDPHTPVASTTVQALLTDRVTISDLNFVGIGTEANTFRLVSANESTNFTLRNCSFDQVHGTCIRLNKADNAFISHVDFTNVTGDVGDPGEGIFALGLIHSEFEYLACAQIGDHLVYLQGQDETDFNRVEDVKISHVTAFTTGVNGLTGGAALICYNKAKNVTHTDIYTKNCRSGIKLGFKQNYFGATTHQLITYEGVVNESPTNRGFEITADVGTLNHPVTFTDSGDTVNRVDHRLVNGDFLYFETIVSTTGIFVDTRYFVISVTTDTFQVAATFAGSSLALTTDGSGTLSVPKPSDITFNNCKTMKCLGAWGMEIENTDFLHIDNCHNTRGAGGGITLIDCNDFTIDNGDHSLNQNNHGIFVSNCKSGTITGCKANLNHRAGLNVSGDCDLIYASNLILIPVTGVNDTFIHSDTATNCVYQNLTLRDFGNQDNSTLTGSAIPTSGNWKRGDRIFFTGPSASGKVGAVCVTGGVPGTWKNFGAIDA